MPRASDAGFEIDVRPRSSSAAVSEQLPFRIAVFGDFSGRRNRKMHGTTPGPVLVDRDNFDAVLAAARPSLNVESGDGGRVELTFSELDDFHPDRLYASLPLFEGLRELRAGASNPGALRQAAPAVRSPIPNLTGGSLLDAMIEGERSTAPQPVRKPDELRAYIQSLVEPYLVPAKSPRQEEMVKKVDEAIARAMGGLLHHPDFQELEAAWRGLFFLVRRLETGPDLKIYVFDISREELDRDLRDASDLRRTEFFKQMCGAEPWALLAGLYSFEPSVDDVDVLARIGMIARQAKAPFLAAARPSVLGCASLAETPEPRDWPGKDAAAEQIWQTLRELPEARWLGLAVPRFLLRLPYGEGADAPELFSFEEAPEHEGYLWGNPALACACLLGQAFQSHGWKMRPGVVRELGKLPLHVHKREGEAVAMPCAEALITDSTAEIILDEGLMPLLSAKDGDRILLPRFSPSRIRPGR
jgi:type VI secretion system protein ImpC